MLTEEWIVIDGTKNLLVTFDQYFAHPRGSWIRSKKKNEYEVFLLFWKLWPASRNDRWSEPKNPKKVWVFTRESVFSCFLLKADREFPSVKRWKRSWSGEYALIYNLQRPKVQNWNLLKRRMKAKNLLKTKHKFMTNILWAKTKIIKPKYCWAKYGDMYW